VATAVGSTRAMVGVPDRGFWAGIRRSRRARTVGRGPRARPRTALQLLFRHATRQRRHPTGRRPVPAAAVRRPFNARPRRTLAAHLAVRVLFAWIRSGGHRCRLDGRVPCQASLRLEDRMQPVRENRLITAATAADGSDTIILPYWLCNVRKSVVYFRVDNQTKFSQNQNKS